MRLPTLEAQRRALVLLENKNGILPLAPDVRRVYLHGIAPEVAATSHRFAGVVSG